MFGKTTLAALQLLPFFLNSALAAPAQSTPELATRQAGASYWLEDTTLRGDATFGPAGYTIFRNVKDYGATGDGTTDDTAAINNAITAQGRCGWPTGGSDCNSTTTTPAIIYFPSGTYVVSTPLNQDYMTQMIGNPNDMPVLKATSSFTGMAVIDADPYDYSEPGSPNWFTNQNNFYRQVRNFVIDLTALPMSTGAGIHWQVAQATSLQNIIFNMVQGGGSANAQKGIFMDNGSGGWMSDLIFNGGGYGAFLGSQQFTSRNMTFNNCVTAVYMNWNWGWTLSGLNINGGTTGVDIANDPTNQTVGSVAIIDSKISGVTTGINSAFSSNSVPSTSGTMYIDNVDFTGTATAVQGPNGQVLAGGSLVTAWGQGNVYSGSSSTQTRQEGAMPQASKPASLLSNGAFVQASRPQYEGLPTSSFQGLKANYGAKGDGVTDDTAAFQNAVNSVPAGSVLYVEHGAYLISNTVHIPAGVQITGEIWPELMITGSAFGDMNNPKPAIQVGTAGETGSVMMSDLVITTQGSVPGGILVEWNLNSADAGASGLWDVHWRIGGAAGTNLQSDTCALQLSTSSPDTNCIGAFMLMHITSSAAGVYMENTWLWTADHELDIAPNEQVQIYTGRGLLIESAGPVWLYGHAVEHNIMYNYQLNNAGAVYMGMIQTETPYYQPDVEAPAPFTTNSAYNDPSFTATGANNDANDSWGLRILNSNDIFVYSAGLYSFFQTWSTACTNDNNCQQNIVDIEGGSNINIYSLSTKAAVNMLNFNGAPVMQGADNENNYCQTILKWSE